VLTILLACTPETSLSRPNAVALAGDLIYVSDFHHQRIVTFDSSGRFISSMGHQGLSGDGLWEVWGLLADGEDLHVLNLRPTSRDDDTMLREIKTFRDGSAVSVTPLVLADGSTAGWSDGMVQTDDGWKLVSLEADSLLSFGADGRVTDERTAPAGGAPLHAPSALHGEADGLWIIEQFDNRIRHLSHDGIERLSFGEEGAQPGALRFPKALDVCDTGGWLAVADLGNYRIQRFDLSGTFIDGFEPPHLSQESPLQLMDVAISSDCSTMALVDSKGDRVLLTEPNGTIFGELSRW
jgi:hypothetical protein